jgi:hypothetical protein
MSRFITKLKEEPTILTQAAQALLGLVVAFGLLGFSEAQTGAVLAVVTAATGVLLALSVRPFTWPVLVGLTQAVILLVAEFGVEVTAAQAGAVLTAVALLGMILRQFVTPEIHLEPTTAELEE